MKSVKCEQVKCLQHVVGYMFSGMVNTSYLYCENGPKFVNKVCIVNLVYIENINLPEAMNLN